MVLITDCQIYKSTAHIPEDWFDLSQNNLFLSLPYLQFLENASPTNFRNTFIGLYSQEKLVGICLAQEVDLRKVDHFGQRDPLLKKAIRGFLFKNFSGKLLIIGNNLMTGAPCFQLAPEVDSASAMDCLKRMIQERFRSTIHLCIFKDFQQEDAIYFNKQKENNFLSFTAQPTMRMQIPNKWQHFTDYLGDLTKKYRDQCKRARK